jgi:hypothetical protein
MTHIEKMLRDGVSAEDLVKEISETKRKIDAETAEKEKDQKKIADSRKDFVTAAINYVSALGIDMGSEDNIKSIIKVLEDSCESYEKHLKHLKAPSSDDEMFADFFNTLFS